MDRRPQCLMLPLQAAPERARTLDLQRPWRSAEQGSRLARRFSTGGSAVFLRRGDVDLEAAWRSVRDFMRARFGLALAPAQSYLLEGRLAGVPEALGFHSLSAYLVAAAAPGASGALTDPLVDALTVSESAFFRDELTWKSLGATVLPRLLARGGPLRIWCAGVGGGHEAYSLAMLLHELDPQAAMHAQILATDIAPQALDRARAGLYGASELSRGVSGERQARHFVRRGAAFEVSPSLRAQVRVMRHNLMDAPPQLRCDLVLCRNTLYYLAPEPRAAVLARLWSAVGPGGALGVESTELLPERTLGEGFYTRG